MQVGDGGTQPPTRRVGLAELFVDAVEVELCALDRNAGLQATDHHQRIAHLIGLVADRIGNQEIDTRAGREERGKVEVGGKYPDHVDRPVVQGNRLTDNPRIAAISPLPEAVGEDHRCGCAPEILLLDEVTSDLWLHAEDIEEIDRYRDAGEALWVPITTERKAEVVEECEIAANLLERLVHGPVVTQVPATRRDR